MNQTSMLFTACKKIFAGFTLVFILNYGAGAQNVSYNLNSIPITGTNNCAIGVNALSSNTFGNHNVAIGNLALSSNTTGIYNIAIGYSALSSNTLGLYNTATGYFALKSTTDGRYNTANGTFSLTANTTGYGNTGLGNQTLISNTTGNYNTATGQASLINNVTGNYNTATGQNSLFNTTGSNNSGMGNYSLYNNTSGSNNTGLGYYADVASGNLINATAIGYNAIVNSSNTIQLGNSSVTQIFAGTGTTAKLIAGGLQITGGTIAAGKVLTSDASGNATWQTPGGTGTTWDLLGNAGTIDGTHFIGTTDNIPLNFRANNQKAGRIDPIFSNSFYGINAGRFTSTGNNNTAVGAASLSSNTTGTNNTGLGASTNVASSTLTNATAIGYGAIVNASNTMQLGNSSVVEVYAGTGTNAKLIAGGLQITGGTLAAGRVLTSDASGNATWQVPSGGGGGFFTTSGLGNIINTNLGGVIIGTGITSFPVGYKLYVSDGILTEKVKVAIKNSAEWADYVFEKNYKLMSLTELEAFVNKNKHLPGIQSADQLVKEGGIDVSQMLSKQMEKIEELTLYLIQLKKENDEVKAKLTALENKK